MVGEKEVKENLNMHAPGTVNVLVSEQTRAEFLKVQKEEPEVYKIMLQEMRKVHDNNIMAGYPNTEITKDYALGLTETARNNHVNNTLNKMMEGFAKDGLDKNEIAFGKLAKELFADGVSPEDMEKLKLASRELKMQGSSVNTIRGTIGALTPSSSHGELIASNEISK
jgi:hypothetical protein